MPEITNGKILLGSLMTVYLLFYAGGMFVSGHIADQVSLRLFLSFGMMVSGILVAGIGFARALDQHSLVYFYSVYAVQGLFQSIGVSDRFVFTNLCTSLIANNTMSLCLFPVAHGCGSNGKLVR